METLNYCNVSFDEATHTYLTTDGLILSGITGRIRERLFPDEYAGVDENVLAAAAARGTLIHKAIQRCDQEGYVPTMEELRNEPLLTAVDDYAAIMSNLDLCSIENEYLITDGHDYASAIDIVAVHGEQVVLIDTKTTYNLNKDYVSWQLSVYAEFFEAQNPHLKVSGLACLWFKVRHGRIEDAQLVDIPRKDREQVQRMLYTDEPIYSGLEEITPELVRLMAKKSAIEKQIETLRAQVVAVMEARGLTSWKCEDAAYSYRKGGTSSRFDSTAFKKAEPDLYKQYTKQVESAPTVVIKLTKDAV